jgi:GT2 family glycosyltransferase
LKAKTTKVSIVMLCWNRWEDVNVSLSRIDEIDHSNLETIVVDNGSTDGSQKNIREEFPWVKLIEAGTNLGIEAYNLGFEAAEGEFILIIDDDSYPAKESIERMVQKFSENPKLGVCAFDVRNADDYDQVARTSKSTTLSHSTYSTGFNGAGAGIRKEVFKKVGFYPGEFFLYMNEADCSLRIRNLGYEIRFFPDLIAYHKMAAKNRKSWRAPFYYTRNSFWLIWKNYPVSTALKETLSLSFRCFYHSMEQLTFIYIKALFSAFWNLSKIADKRFPVKEEVVNEMRIPLNLCFTFYR